MWITRALLSLALAALLVSGADSLQLVAEENFGVGSPIAFLPKYLAFRAQQLRNANPDVLRIRLGQVKGLSRSFNRITGETTVNLRNGAFEVRLNQLTTGLTYSVWLLEEGDSDAIPPVPDTVFRLATLLAVLPTHVLTGTLGLNLPLGFTLDRVVVAKGLLSSTDVQAAGSVNVFQKIFFRRLSLTNESAGSVAFAETTARPSRFDLIPDLVAAIDAARLAPPSSPSLGTLFQQPDSASAEASASSSAPIDRLISQGATFFFEKTFGGNGRTCGTCHPSSNNFTIDVPFINSLPANDPLFVAEFNPALGQLEKPTLMRQFGLILENVDGLEDPTRKFVMRGVPHTLGLQVSLQPDTSLTNPPADMTGWSGDGAPQTGSLRDFAIGAVTQHFTKSLNRVRGRDFKLPNAHQLDAMEAFQLSLGRTTDFDLSRITFNNTDVAAGQGLFINGTGGGTCAFCHTNAGALAAAPAGQNRNFNTNVEDREHPARDVEDFPIDGGFGQAGNTSGTFGNLTFNTASVVEAADTAPFFHNNVVGTLEDVVRFYSGPEFNTPRAPAAQFSFNEIEVGQIADFMRGVNTLQNIDVARRELDEILALSGNPQNEIAVRLQTAFDETDDAIKVLNDGGIFPFAVTRLTSARSRIAQAQNTSNQSQRRTLVQQAITELVGARDNVATVAP